MSNWTGENSTELLCIECKTIVSATGEGWKREKVTENIIPGIFLIILAIR